MRYSCEKGATIWKGVLIEEGTLNRGGMVLIVPTKVKNYFEFNSINILRCDNQKHFSHRNIRMDYLYSSCI